MFYKKLPNGKYRYFEKYFNQRELKWKQVTVTMNGKTRLSQAEARNRLAKKIEEAQNNFQERKIEKATVQEVFEGWTLLRAQEVQESTYITEIGLFVDFLKEFGGWQVRVIKTVHLQNYLMGRHTLKNSTRRNLRAKINMFFTYMERLGYIEDNPVEKVVLPRESLNLEEFEKKHSKFFSIYEMRQFLGALEKECQSEGRMRKMYLAEFLYLTGLRINEALALRFIEPFVDLENHTITVRYSLDKKSYNAAKAKLSKTKNPQSIRTISINSRAVEILQWFQEANRKFPSEFVFLNDQGNIIIPSCFNDFLKKYGAKASIEGKDASIYSAHMFRHSHISLLAELGISQKATMERVGQYDLYARYAKYA